MPRDQPGPTWSRDIVVAYSCEVLVAATTGCAARCADVLK